jgi:hypothetical protein
MSLKPHQIGAAHACIRIEEKEKRIVIRWWFGSVCWSLLFCCILWDAITGVLLVGISRHGIFAIPFVAFAVALTYFTMAMICNRTTVIVSESAVQVFHWPLPWKGNRTLTRKSIAHLRCIPGLTITGSAGPWKTLANIKAYSTDGRTCILVRSLDRSDAEFVIRQLEKWLRQPPGQAT